ncbi:hypothetical protein MTO96_019460 [Rhipicephalus appendiculatus]
MVAGNVTVTCSLSIDGVVAELMTETECGCWHGSRNYINVDARMCGTTGRLEVTSARNEPAFLRTFVVDNSCFEVTLGDNLYLSSSRRSNFESQIRRVGAEELIGMTQLTVSNIIHEVAEAIIVLGRRRKLVDFALTPAAKVDLKVGFARRGTIPGVPACVDGTLVAIQKPEGLSIADTVSFMTRNCYYAPNVMVVCDADLRILVIDPPFSGVMPRLLGVEAQPTVEAPRLTTSAW